MSDCGVEELTNSRQHLGSGVAVVELMVESRKADQLRPIARIAQGGDHLAAVLDIDVPIEVAVEQEDRRLDLRSSSQWQSLDNLRSRSNETADQPGIREIGGLSL